MRVAIAGTGGLAYWIAHYLSTETFHQFILLSRAPKPHLAAKGWQIVVVDYENQTDLLFQLAGVDAVVSTVSGGPQLALIEAAARVGARRFAPAEFTGSSVLRPTVDPLDRGQRAAIARLQFYKPQGMAYTVFSCGILYERFAPGGSWSSNIGRVSGIGEEGDYIFNMRTMKAQVPHDSSGQPATVCMTASQDVGHFIVAALDLPEWPSELRMCGERMSVSDVVTVGELLRRQEFERANHNPESLRSLLLLAQSTQDFRRQLRAHTLIATAEGRLDFVDANLNGMVNVTPTRFQAWLQMAWANELG